jgi:hypothetical protein
MNDTQPPNIHMSDCAFPSLTQLAMLVSSILLHIQILPCDWHQTSRMSVVFYHVEQGHLPLAWSIFLHLFIAICTLSSRLAVHAFTQPSDKLDPPNEQYNNRGRAVRFIRRYFVIAQHWQALVKVVLNNGLQRIGGLAFNHCTSLRHIKIPSSVTSIDDWAFFGCINLVQVALYDGLK